MFIRKTGLILSGKLIIFLKPDKKEKLGELPDDLFVIEFFLDTYTFSDCTAYSGDGIVFRFSVFRKELDNFVNKLETERGKIIENYADNSEGHGRANKD